MVFKSFAYIWLQRSYEIFIKINCLDACCVILGRKELVICRLVSSNWTYEKILRQFIDVILA